VAVVPNRFLREGRELPSELEEQRLRIEDIARNKYGLDFFETIFEMCTYEEINMIASYGGFPTRYPHWRFGMEYLQMQTSYEYGLSKIYEMVINTNPSYAYLMDCNLMVDQKLVMGHVFAHVDFFKNNLWFRHTNRRMLDQMANHATVVRTHMDKEGVGRVEQFIDLVLSIDNLIDPHLPHIRRGEAATAAFDASASRLRPQSPPPKPRRTRIECRPKTIWTSTSTRPSTSRSRSASGSKSSSACAPSRTSRCATCSASCSSTRRSLVGNATSSPS